MKNSQTEDQNGDEKENSEEREEDEEKMETEAENAEDSGEADERGSPPVKCKRVEESSGHSATEPKVVHFEAPPSPTDDRIVRILCQSH